MWLFLRNKFSTHIVIISSLIALKTCEAITNDNFNEQIRDYTVDHPNLTDVKTLQKQSLGLGRYASFAPVQNVVKFKDVPDNVISESSRGRKLVHHDPNGYAFDYEDPHYGYDYDYKHHDHHHDYDHHYIHDDDHHRPHGYHHGYGHHHKHYDHGLATKTLLWPIAGIALLGAAAALVTNPVLLQLGVVSGKRKRRQIEDIEDAVKDSFKKWSPIEGTRNNKALFGDKNNDNNAKAIKKMMHRKDTKLVKRLQRNERSAHYEGVKTYQPISEEDQRFIQIPLKIHET